MNATATSPTGAHGLAGVNRTWMLVVGILMTLCGVIGLTMAYAFTLIVLFWFGVLAMVAGVSQVFDAFHHKAWKGFIWHALVGVIYILAGFVLIFRPTSSAFWVTLFIAASLIGAGVTRLFSIFALRGRFGLQVFVGLAGVLSIVLGIIIFQSLVPADANTLSTPEGQAAWTQSWQWIIGLFVAIELLIEGVTLISIALTAKKEAEA
jgi:uncharacterized membrane protein HdeD (DUF308 family)